METAAYSLRCSAKRSVGFCVGGCFLQILEAQDSMFLQEMLTNDQVSIDYIIFNGNKYTDGPKTINLSLLGMNE